MKMRRLILLGILVLSLVLITACDGGLPGNGGDGDSLVGDGKIMGTIENFNAEAGQILDVHVMLLEELDVNGEIELDDLIIAETTASSSDNYYTYEYSIDNIPEGEYYVAAFKDLNGNGSLDIGEGPIDAFGFYGLPELSEIPDELEGPPGNPEPVVIEGDETVTEIDFPAFSVALTTIEDFNGVVYNASGDPLEAEVEVELYGTAGIKLAEGIHNSTTGEYYFEDLLVPGEYYIKTSSAGLMPSITPLFYLLNDSVISDMPADLNLFLWSAFDLDVLPEDPISLMVVDNDGNCECLPDILMYTEGEAEYWGYESGNVFFTGQVTAAHGRILDPTYDGIAGAEVILDPALGNIGYFYVDIEENWILDFGLEETIAESGGWFVIQGVPDGEYSISANHNTSNFFVYKVIVEADTCITIEVAEN